MKSFLTICCLLMALTTFGQINVYVMLAEECPISNSMGTALSEVGNAFGAQVHLYAVFPVSTSTPASAGNFLKAHGMESYKPILDSRQQLARKLGAHVTPEVVITNDAGVVIYRGRITDLYSAPGKKNNSAAHNDIEEAISLALNGRAVPQPWPRAIGCAITFQK